MNDVGPPIFWITGHEMDWCLEVQHDDRPCLDCGHPTTLRSVEGRKGDERPLCPRCVVRVLDLEHPLLPLHLNDVPVHRDHLLAGIQVTMLAPGLR